MTLTFYVSPVTSDVWLHYSISLCIYPLWEIAVLNVIHLFGIFFLNLLLITLHLLSSFHSIESSPVFQRWWMQEGAPLEPQPPHPYQRTKFIQTWGLWEYLFSFPSHAAFCTSIFVQGRIWIVLLQVKPKWLFVLHPKTVDAYVSLKRFFCSTVHSTHILTVIWPLKGFDYLPF